MTAEQLVRALIKEDMLAEVYVLDGNALAQLRVVAKNHVMPEWSPPKPIIILSAVEFAVKGGPKP
jgi:hypothetical protein